MPQKSPALNEFTAAKLQTLGAKMARKRKAVGVSATVAAEVAGMSRITLHRIEKANPLSPWGHGVTPSPLWAWNCTFRTMKQPNLLQQRSPAGGLCVSRWPTIRSSKHWLGKCMAQIT